MSLFRSMLSLAKLSELKKVSVVFLSICLPIYALGSTAACLDFYRHEPKLEITPFPTNSQVWERSDKSLLGRLRKYLFIKQQKASASPKLLLPDVDLSETDHSELAAARERLMQFKFQFPKNRPSTFPKSIKVRGTTYFVREFLGQGAAGSVYLVESNGEFFSAKIFHNNRSVGSEVRDLMKVWKKGGRVLPIQNVDTRNGIILFPYVNGISVHEIVTGYFEFKSPISFELKEKIRAAYSRAQFNFDVRHSFNVLLDLDTGRFIIMDLE